MKKKYISPEIIVETISGSEIMYGSVYLDNDRADINIYDEKDEPEVTGYDPTWGVDSGDDGWQLW